jgi:transposase
MYVGLDVSKKEIVYIGKDSVGNELYHNCIPTSIEGMNTLISDIGAGNILTVEASTHGIFVYDYLISRGMDVKMANPSKLRLIYDSWKKTDNEDALKLAELLRMNALPVCYVPDKRTRELRDIIRYGRSIVESRTKLKNQIRALVAREGIDVPYKDILGLKAVKMLKKIDLSNEIKGDILNRRIDIALRYKSEINDCDEKISEKFTSMKYADLLDSVPGISTYSAVHIASAIGNIRRFPSDQELASYAGLVPKISQSGERRRDSGLKPGDMQLSTVLIQDANAAIKCSRYFKKYYLKQKKRKGHQKAMVSVARKMVEIIYVMLTRGKSYRENYRK